MKIKKGGTEQLLTVLALLLLIQKSEEFEFDLLNPCFEKCGLGQSSELLQNGPCYDDYSVLPDAIREPLECFSKCNESPFDCSSQGRDLFSRLKQFVHDNGRMMASFVNLHLFRSSIHALIWLDDSSGAFMLHFQPICHTELSRRKRIWTRKSRSFRNFCACVQFPRESSVWHLHFKLRYIFPFIRLAARQISGTFSCRSGKSLPFHEPYAAHRMAQTSSATWHMFVPHIFAVKFVWKCVEILWHAIEIFQKLQPECIRHTCTLTSLFVSTKGGQRDGPGFWKILSRS